MESDRKTAHLFYRGLQTSTYKRADLDGVPIHLVNEVRHAMIGPPYAVFPGPRLTIMWIGSIILFVPMVGIVALVLAKV